MFDKAHVLNMLCESMSSEHVTETESPDQPSHLHTPIREFALRLHTAIREFALRLEEK